MFGKKTNSNIPKVHRKVRKHDMLFEYFLVFLLVVSFIFLSLCILGVIKANPQTIATVLAAMIALYALVWQLFSAIKAQRILASIKLEAKVDKTRVQLTCTLENIGTKSLYPYLTNLYITEGIQEENGDVTSYRFEPFTEHTIDRDTGECFDCELATHCKSQSQQEVSKGIITLPPVDKDFANTLRFVQNLRELSYYSLVHIMPKESFRQDVVLNIEKEGVYRAFVIYTGKEWDDCICTTTMFQIKK